ncbi:hypothetical protein CTI12_AA355830 [Artemisia annua]|uniref:RNA-directed DNA polymerase, eukaryota, Reverse transcriptase zinc-binding domain protein n=1 Tax=Artemisia annua TaxID=35608 RepID=A0A2U1MQD6_ARTAN|nr:hypothetical protein CTI12_AA355830 [Artemisia annua]
MAVWRERPKDQGSLGLKNSQTWNEVLLMKHIWNVAAKKDSLWVKWVNVESRSLWEVRIDSNSSWGWKTLLKLRDRVRQHIVFKERNMMLFQQSQRTEDTLFQLSVDSVKLKMMNFIVKNSADSRNVEKQWNKWFC